MSNILTCVYCGQAYPEGTPPHGSKVLTNHIRVCEKHPMRELETRYANVRAALVKMTGCETLHEQQKMEGLLNSLPDDENKAIALIGLRALIENP